MEIIDPEWASQNPEAAQARLIDARRDDFESRYRPLEEAAIAEFMKSPEEAASRAQGISTSAFGRVSAMTDRSLGRRGVFMTADQAAAAQAATDLDRVRAGATGANLTRRHVTDRNIEGLGTMAGIGRGVQGAGLSGMGDASGMANARNEAGRAARQQHRAGQLQTVSSMAGLGMMAGTAGVMGLTAGTGLAAGLGAGALLAFI